MSPTPASVPPEPGSGRAVLELAGVGKRYEVDSQPSLVARLRRRPRTETWALRDVTVDVAPGEVVAVIGRNGAGKSTMLKVAAGVTAPTTGSVRRPRRVAPLIEVGAGFHPELTGRENVFVNARLLGLGTAETRRRFDDIVGFAELAHVIDRPVRQYSSGMFMRLGFAVAVHTRPALLIVDEVLAVGDVPFQARCLERIQEIRAAGAGILFVSHDLNAVLDLADRALLLDAGVPSALGGVDEVVGAYHRLLDEAAEGDVPLREAPTTGELRVERVALTDVAGRTPSLWAPGDRAVLTLVVRAERPSRRGLVGVSLHRQGGGNVARYQAEEGPFIPELAAGETAEVSIGLTLSLTQGGYSLDVAVVTDDWSAVLVREPGAARFGVGSRRGGSGLVDLEPAVSVRASG